ncbi:MAG: DUF11 domain-containing protein, partial [Aphanizomenon flos-aquae CP01]|nr:DUF11 domain-containing protein [Aphanizomenon flos-aquae CP01]
MTDNIFVDPLPNQDMRVSTDKADYAPGETVKITAGGFAKDSTIQFEIKDDPNDPGDDGEADVYKPFSITDGGAGDLDGIANGQVLAAWGVPTDNNGTGSGTPDALNGTLNLTATDPDGQAATTMFMDSGGAYSINFAAADPKLYGEWGPTSPTNGVSPTLDKLTVPGTVYTAFNNPNPPAAYFGNPTTGVDQSVESLAPKGLTLGQIVAFEILVTVDANGNIQPENGTIRFTSGWSTETTSGKAFGYDENYLVYSAFIDSGDKASKNLDGNETLSYTSAWVDTGGSSTGDEIQGTFTVGGLDPGDQAVVEVWMVLDNKATADSINNLNGNVQSRLVSAQTVPPTGTPDTINTGNQTVPLLKVQGFVTPVLELTKTPDVTSVDAVGDQIVYTYVLTNVGVGAAQDIKLIDDAYTPGVPGDDVSPTPVLSGDYNIGDTNTNDLLDPGEFWKYNYTYPVISTDLTKNTLVNIATADGKPTSGNDNVDPVTATATVNVISNADLSILKTDGGITAIAGQNFTYMLTVTNNGPRFSSGWTITDTLPTGMTFVSADNGDIITTTNSDGTVTF